MMGVCATLLYNITSRTPSLLFPYLALMIKLFPMLTKLHLMNWRLKGSRQKGKGKGNNNGNGNSNGNGNGNGRFNIMDNQATNYIKTFLTKEQCKLQLLKPHNHRINVAMHAIQTFKDAFIATLATTNLAFLLQLGDHPTPQVLNCLNMMHASCTCWETESARPSPLVPVKSNLSDVPTSPSEGCSADLEVSSCSKIHFLLYL
jgi:hypothetical protein